MCLLQLQQNGSWRGMNMLWKTKLSFSSPCKFLLSLSGIWKTIPLILWQWQFSFLVLFAMQLISETKVLKKTPSFQDMDYLILETAILTLANRFRNDFLLKEENFNKAMQFAAYQQFTLWRCGFMGANRRKPIRSCCVGRIRRKFPSSLGYIGFRASRLYL